MLQDDLARVDRVLYLIAAMTGLRQGELLALRRMDIDWVAQRIRVRRNYVRGRFGTPKSKRSSRSVPLADEVAGELDVLFKASAYQADEDLVFGHPHTGRPLDRSQVLKRFKRTLKRAGVRPIRFHDLRHTFGTRMAAAGVPMRTLQEDGIGYQLADEELCAFLFLVVQDPRYQCASASRARPALAGLAVGQARGASVATPRAEAER